MKNGVFILCLAICLLFALSSVCAGDVNDAAVASDDTDQVIGEVDDDAVSEMDEEAISSSQQDIIGEPDNGTFTALQKRINDADADSTIELENDYAYDDGFDINGISVSKPLTIDGKGYTIDAKGKSRVFHITSAVTLKNLTIKNANYNGNGGAVYFNGNGYAKDCNFINNTARYGGAMFGGSAVNCSFVNNSAEQGGAIRDGSAVNCSFAGNSAEYGGAIIAGYAVNCSFAGNSAEQGGAIRDGSAVNCSFAGNSANSGGAMFDGSAVNCSFVGNSASFGGGKAYGSAVDCSFVGNSAVVFGAAMANGYKMNCISQDDYYNTYDLKLYWDANDFTSYGSAGKLPIQLKNQVERSVDFINYDVVIYKDGINVRTYHCLSNEELSLDLAFGIYTAELSVTYPGINQPEPKNIALTVVDDTSFAYLNKSINGNANDTITLDRDYAFNPIFDSAFVEGIVINRPVAINGSGHSIDAQGKARAFYVNASHVTINDLTIKNANYDGDGGAIYFNNQGNVTNCKFTNNTARNGGAIYGSALSHAIADSCIFKTITDTVINTHVFSPTLTADDFTSVYGSVEKLTFNLETRSGMPITEGNISISLYCKNNDSLVGEYSCLSGNGWAVDFPAGSYYAIFITDYAGFKPINRTITINKANSELDLSDVTLDYGISASVLVTTQNATGIAAEIDGKGVTVEDNKIMIPYLEGGLHILTVTTITDSNHNNVTKRAIVTVNKLKTELTADAINVTYNDDADLTITLKDIHGKPLADQALLVDFNGAKIYDLTDLNGTIKVSVEGLEVNTYAAQIIFMGNENYTGSNATATVTVVKDSTSLSGDEVITTYNVNRDLVVTLKDSQDNPIKGCAVTVDLNGVKTFTTDANGQIKVATGSLVPKVHTAKITFKGNGNYIFSSKEIKVTVKKATPKLTAKNNNFKAKKVKKYKITLKSGKTAIKKVKVTLKIKGKTYKAKTNAKGKATFKIKKLTRKGTFKAVIKFKGNKYYKAVTKKVKIKIK